ncbi:hypothetical protein [Haloplanus halophilus]|uniref:hypothetical protein n=1 Tax=Haloplanus halophilus TaxID=2949993 RepID=UPI00203D5354|nr:hypothetical protein [Haloplanus sp. GDY1]
MNQRRIGDIFLGVTMILIGIAPLGLALTGREHLIAGYGVDVISGTLNTVLVVVFIVCGLVLAVAGANVVKNGRSESESSSLY